MDRPRRVPWVDWHEWSTVFDRVIRDSPEHRDREHVVAKVKVWNARGKVPVAVNATARLFEACAMLDSVRNGISVADSIRDSNLGSNSNGQGWNSDHDDVAPLTSISEAFVRHAVALVVVRFVNGVCDAQQNGVYARYVHCGICCLVVWHLASAI